MGKLSPQIVDRCGVDFKITSVKTAMVYPAIRKALHNSDPIPFETLFYSCKSSNLTEEVFDGKAGSAHCGSLQS